MRQSHTAVIARNEVWEGEVATEPYEVAWASEAIFFLRLLDGSPAPSLVELSVQVSPDGLYWCDHGAKLRLTAGSEGPEHVGVKVFGGWLRLSGTLPSDTRIKVITYLALKE